MASKAKPKARRPKAAKGRTRGKTRRLSSALTQRNLAALTLDPEAGMFAVPIARQLTRKTRAKSAPRTRAKVKRTRKAVKRAARRRRRASAPQTAVKTAIKLINRAGRTLPQARKKILRQAKTGLRRLYNRL
jgi:hypothetical protein